MRADAVGKRYGRGRWILEDITVNVPAGAVVAFHGRNGSGKSTLLRLLAGLTRPTRGTITSRPAAIGYVPDCFSPPERLSALGYLTHLGRIRGLATEQVRGRAHTLLERLSLAGGAHAELRTLSKGNAQKVALAQALLVQPELLILDEPWSGLDASAHGVLAEIIAEVSGAGGSVVFTGHGGAARGTAVTTAHLVAHGRLHPRTPEVPREQRPVTELVLQRPLGDGDLPSPEPPLSPHDSAPPQWSRAPGVLSATGRHGDLVLEVERADADAVLLAALRDGWSAASVSRTAPTQHRGSAGAAPTPAMTADGEPPRAQAEGTSPAPAPVRTEGGHA